LDKYAEFIIRFRKMIIILTICITIFFSFGLKRLTINSDITTYLKPNDPVVKLFKKIGDEFGGNLIVMIAIKSDNIISYPILSFIRDLSHSYSEIEGIFSVTSLTNILDIKKTDFGLEVSKLINKNNIPQDENKLEALKKYILSKNTYKGKIISEDGTTTLIICRLKPGFNKVDTAKAIKNITEKSKGSYKVYYCGYPAQMVEMGKYLSKDLKTLIPLVIVVIILVLYISFKTMRGVLLPLTVVVISTIWTMGLMGYTNTPLSIVSNIVPVILLGIGTAYSIHFLSRYHEDVSTEDLKLQSIKKSLKHVGIPILLTGITTITGFLSFTGVYITAITDFGIFTAFGVFIAMVLSISLLPAVLSCLKVKNTGALNDSKHLLKKFMGRNAQFVLKNEKLIIILSFSIAILSVLIIPRIKTESQITKYFPKYSNIRKADAVIKNDFGGSTPIQVMIKGDIKSPFLLGEVIRMEKYLEQLPFVSNTQSLADLICQMNDVINGHNTIPETKEEVANLLFLLEGEEVLEQMVNEEYSEGIIHATFGTDDNKILKNTISNINTYIQQNINKKFIKISKNDIDITQKKIINNWINNHISQTIYYDTKKFNIKENIDVNNIKNVLDNINYRTDKFLTEAIKDKLYDELYIFFEEESEIIIDLESEIESIINALVILTEKTTITKANIISTLKNKISKKYWIDYPESIEHTAEYINTKLLNAQNEYKIVNTANLLINKLYPDFANNPDFIKEIQDDLWLLTENSIAVPSTLIDNYNLDKNNEEISPHAELSGFIMIADRLNVSLIKSQIQSVLIALTVVFLFLSVQFKSIRMGAITISPIILVILLNFGIMGYLNIPLDYATMLVGSIMIGVGIDYSIHFSSRFKDEYKMNHNEKVSLEKTLKTTGTAIMINALMVALGFFVLVAGNLVCVKREGWMIGVLMLISAFASISYLPAIILTLRKFLKINNNG